MRTVRGRLVAGMAGLCMAVSGCSWILIDGPPAGHENMDRFECDEGRWPAWFDVAVAGLSVVGAVTAEDDPEDDWWGLNASTKVVGNVGIAVVSIASAWTGFRRTTACAEAKRALMKRTTGR